MTDDSIFDNRTASVPAVGLGPLAIALAKASAGFGTVTRDKKVTITTQKGGSYSFSYAPLESILAAVRKPLADNGLAVVQMLDSGDLVTTLIHESGASITGRIALPQVDDIKGLGSAVTYLRRYAIQAALGIAAEDDDDGSAATGDRVVSAGVEHGADGSLIGVVQVGDKITSDYVIRNGEDGAQGLGFRLVSDKGDKGGILVEARGDLAVQLDAHRRTVIGNRVTVYGSVQERSFTPKGKTKVTYQALAAERIFVPTLGLLPAYDMAEPEPLAEAPTVPLFTDAEQAAIDADIDAVLA